MKAVQRYKAEDGTEFATADEAIRRDQLLADIAFALLPIGEQPERGFSNGEGYIQHEAEAVLRVKSELVRLARRELRGDFPILRVPPAEIHNHSFMGRLLDECSRPLYRAWWRLMCIDEQHREWGQPYFALNPDKGVQREWRPKSVK